MVLDNVVLDGVKEFANQLMEAFGKVEISLGLVGVSGSQELWRFLTLEKAHDLFRTNTLYLRQVALLRVMDDRESRLPIVIRQRMALVNRDNPRVRQFIDNMLDLAENQADRVYASCWYLPDPSEHYEHMWRNFGGGDEGGGVCGNDYAATRESSV